MTKKQQENVTINIPISITKERLAKLSESNPDIPTSELLSGVATGLLADVADGGMMVEAHYLQRIADLAGTISSPEDIVRPVEQYARRSSGNKVFQVVMDQAWVEPIRYYAEQQGRTEDEIFQEALDILLGHTDWIYEIQEKFEVRHLYFTKEDMDVLRSILDKDTFTGRDLVNFLQAHVVEEAPIG